VLQVPAERRRWMKGFKVAALGAVAVMGVAVAGGAGAATMDGFGTVEEMAPGSYVRPEGWTTLLDFSVGEDYRFRTNAWYTVGLQDWMVGGELNVVFHNVYNDGEDYPDILNLYVYDGSSTQGLLAYSGEDASSLLTPDWGALGAVWIGAWMDDDDLRSTNDVVFRLDFSRPELAALLNGNSFTIGIDPDCAYHFDRVTIDTPVPEPASLLLFGTGLGGAAFLCRRRQRAPTA
jgi:hypothetical protein